MDKATDQERLLYEILTLYLKCPRYGHYRNNNYETRKIWNLTVEARRKNNFDTATEEKCKIEEFQRKQASERCRFSSKMFRPVENSEMKSFSTIHIIEQNRFEDRLTNYQKDFIGSIFTIMSHRTCVDRLIAIE